ncbi:CBS domain-containing protein [Stenomitos frigidus]|uniref:Poly(A) polymerase n=1 Tax=Stenomitos frigidus ULC18 TaxID=2107698 RepID=A0A2T1DTN9_9CYAN|nr:CBS domain-containing protein [Stenomitos frigidus]PSB23869.1 poly(A) polymerase [Stenomitos frigidus ULC18]
MNLILCHTTADFDTLGAAVGLTRLQPGARIVLAGGAHPAVRDFLALHRDEYALMERRAVNPEQIQAIAVVDTQFRDRLGKTAEWLDLPNVALSVYDHHLGAESDLPTAQRQVEAVGATTTLIVEHLQAQQVTLTIAEATVMALGIHVDTGSLTFDQTTARDARALAWLMEHGASLRAIAQYANPGLTPDLQPLLTTALESLQTETVHGRTIGWVMLTLDSFVPGLSSLASHLMSLTDIDALLLAAHYCKHGDCHTHPYESDASALTVIGRSRLDGTNLDELFSAIGGGGHPRAASVNLHAVEPQETLLQLVAQFKAQIPHPPVARDLMSSPVRTIRPDTTIEAAQRLLLRYGHSGLSVVDADGRLIGIISRRDLDIALHHGFSQAPVKGYMTTNLKTVTPQTSLPDIESLMVTYDIGRLPVLDQDSLVGIVTRTDVLRQLHNQARSEQERSKGTRDAGSSSTSPNDSQLDSSLFSSNLLLTPHSTAKRKQARLLTALRQCLKPELWQLLSAAATEAEQRGWHLYLVGGAVRDLLLTIAAGQVAAGQATTGTLLLEDVDLVVDGFHQAATVGAGVEMARSLQTLYPDARLEVHGKFQTAALLWHNDPLFKSLWVDLATARTEFYPYPAANPEVEASSIRQDLYRRDFTINAMAIRLTEPHPGELLDFFGGELDLQAKQIRVLHANSFIEDPTRIYRAVRFAVRLGFQLDAQTEGYIRYAIDSGIYAHIQAIDSQATHIQTDRQSDAPLTAPALQTRLKAELKYILQSPYWEPALQKLSALDALQCIHLTLTMDETLWRQLRLVDRALRRLRSERSAVSGQEAGDRRQESASSVESPLDSTQNVSPPHSGSKLQPSAFSLTALPPLWLIRLEVLLAQLAPMHRGAVAANLQLPADSLHRLQQLDSVQTTLTTALPHCDRPSQVIQLLKPYDPLLLTFIALRSRSDLQQADRAASPRRKLWRYLTCWYALKPLLDGNDLKALGYKPGPQFKAILEALTAATVDSVIHTRSEAESFVADRFAQEKDKGR